MDRLHKEQQKAWDILNTPAIESNNLVNSKLLNLDLYVQPNLAGGFTHIPVTIKTV